MDVIRGAVRDLGDTEVTGPDAQEAAKTAEQLERQLWRWRRSVEAAWLDRFNHLPAVIGELADKEGVPPLVIVRDLLDTGALRPEWYKLDRYATPHGVSMWPTDSEQKEHDNE